MNIRKIISTAATAAALFASNAKAAEISWYTDKEGAGVVVLSGSIVNGDALKILRIMENALQNRDTYIKAIRLNTGGGDVDEGFRLANVIRKFNISTVVPANAYCASACFLAFAAGTEKYVGSNAQVGVHSARDAKTNREDANSAAATINMVRYLDRLGVPKNITGRLATTAPDDMAWLTRSELAQMNAVVTGSTQVTSAPETTTTPAAPVNDEEIAWQKYYRWAVSTSAAQNGGRALAKNNCNAKFCATQIGYYERNGRFATAVELKVNGGGYARAVCRQTYATDTYRVCTDFVSEKNTAQVLRGNIWVTVN